MRRFQTLLSSSTCAITPRERAIQAARVNELNESQGIPYGRGDFRGFGGEVGGQFGGVGGVVDGQFGGELGGHGNFGDVGDASMGGQFGEFRVDERLYPPDEYATVDQSVSRAVTLDASQSVTDEGQQYATPPGQYPPSPEQLKQQQQLYQQQHSPLTWS
jgi:hypothetical protein